MKMNEKQSGVLLRKKITTTPVPQNGQQKGDNRVEKATVEELNKRVELRELVDQTIESVAHKIQDSDMTPGDYSSTIMALASLIGARAIL